MLARAPSFDLPRAYITCGGKDSASVGQWLQQQQQQEEEANCDGEPMWLGQSPPPPSSSGGRTTPGSKHGQLGLGVIIAIVAGALMGALLLGCCVYSAFFSPAAKVLRSQLLWRGDVFRVWAHVVGQILYIHAAALVSPKYGLPAGTIGLLWCVSLRCSSRADPAYGHHKEQGDRKAILVFHLGGRTAGATVFNFIDRTAFLIAARSDPFLGGDDFTGRVVDHFAELIKKQHDMDVREDKNAMLRLTAACERAKQALSGADQEETLVEVESLLAGGANFTAPLTRTKFEELNRDLFERAMALVDQAVMRRGKPRVFALFSRIIDRYMFASTSIKQLRSK
ncbi:hypothetical protein ACP70R_039447 [Stipagrostis hirtigluma subsp. patula]